MPKKIDVKNPAKKSPEDTRATVYRVVIVIISVIVILSWVLSAVVTY